MELLLDHWGSEPPPALRSGGLGVRDLKAAAALLHVDEPVAALLVETATAAGLLATGVTADGDAGWVPTDAFDAWSALDPGDPLDPAGRRVADEHAAAGPGRHP